MNEKKEKIKPRIFIQIHLSQEEKDKIDSIAKKQHTSMSNICREGIFEYIRKIENPEILSNTSINPALLEQIRNTTIKTLELQELMLEKTHIINDMNKTLDSIYSVSIKPTPIEKELVLNLFKGFKSLNPKEIIDKTNLKKELVFSILSELRSDNLIKLTLKGRFKLNE